MQTRRPVPERLGNLSKITHGKASSGAHGFCHQSMRWRLLVLRFHGYLSVLRDAHSQFGPVEHDRAVLFTELPRLVCNLQQIPERLRKLIIPLVYDLIRLNVSKTSVDGYDG